MTSDREAEAALPPGVAKGCRLDTTPTEQQLAAGGVGPGGQPGPDPTTRRLQEGRTDARDFEGQSGPGEPTAPPKPD